MTDTLKDILARIDTWPAEVREEAAEALLAIEAAHLDRDTDPSGKQKESGAGMASAHTGKGADADWLRVLEATERVRLAAERGVVMNEEDSVELVKAYRRSRRGNG